MFGPTSQRYSGERVPTIEVTFIINPAPFASVIVGHIIGWSGTWKLEQNMIVHLVVQRKSWSGHYGALRIHWKRMISKYVLFLVDQKVVKFKTKIFHILNFLKNHFCYSHKREWKLWFHYWFRITIPDFSINLMSLFWIVVKPNNFSQKKFEKFFWIKWTLNLNHSNICSGNIHLDIVESI